MYKEKKKIGIFLKGVVSLCYKIEFNATACTDQHLGGGCSKTEAEIEIFRSRSFQKDIRRWNALAKSQMMEIKKVQIKPTEGLGLKSKIEENFGLL